MPIVKVSDLAYARLQSPSLDEAEEFLTAFGLVRTERTHDRLYMRGTDAPHHIHVTHLGPSRFIGLAFYVESEDDLKRVAGAPGASGVEHADEPGGGQRVRLTDPLGYPLEVVFGMQQLAPLPTPVLVLNTGSDKLRRSGEFLRLEPRRPSHVKRIAHAVLMAPNALEKIRWYRETLGLLASDEVYEGSADNVVASFNRCDRGERFVDHHTLLCFESPNAGLNHISFEVQSFDDLMVGHELLKQRGKYRHVWGVGRHLLGSQVFDYWEDPWRRVHEHWTDSDVLNVHAAAGLHPIEIGLSNQWGDPPPQEFVRHAIP
ncbi:MAG TPA: catechol 1,2-dioxygenase [Gammaproteobacteria bacterium]|nr:catechol 1,2-dioxygenase [Gammaproteobacteria bacterium]